MSIPVGSCWFECFQTSTVRGRATRSQRAVKTRGTSPGFAMIPISLRSEGSLRMALRSSKPEASVDAEIDTGDGTSASMTGTITVGGQLDLPSAPVLPADPDVNVQLENWRSRADDPSEMTGTYEAFLTAPGVSGSVRLMLQLEDVFRTTAATATSLNGGSARARIRDLVAAHLEHRR